MLCYQIEYNQMQKRVYLKKTTSPRSIPPCIICQYKKNSDSCVDFYSHIIANKYRYPPPQLQQSITNQIISKKPQSPNYISFKYALNQSYLKERLIQYHTFQSTVTLIKSLILERTSKDIIPLINFSSMKHSQITMRRYGFIKQNKQKKQQFKCILPKNGSGTSTDEEVYSSPVKTKKATQPEKKPPQTIAVQRMTRNLSNMLRKYQEKFQFHPSQIFEIIDSVPGHVLDITELEKQFKFQKQLLDNFSIIQEHKPTEKFTIKPLVNINPKQIERFNTISGQRLQTAQIERLHTAQTERLQTVPCNMEDNIYGFKNRGNVALSRNINKMSRQNLKKGSKSRGKWLKQNMSPNVRVHTDYDCEVIKKQKKRSINSKQLGKGLSPSLKLMGKSKGKIKVSQSRSKLGKKY